MLRLGVGRRQPLGETEQGGVDAVHGRRSIAEFYAGFTRRSLWIDVEPGDGLRLWG
jgi:hypothetical protein